MYLLKKVQIPEEHPLYGYCDNICHKVNNLYNASLFVCRQTFTGLGKPEGERQPLEKEMLEKINGLGIGPGGLGGWICSEDKI